MFSFRLHLSPGTCFFCSLIRGPGIRICGKKRGFSLSPYHGRKDDRSGPALVPKRGKSTGVSGKRTEIQPAQRGFRGFPKYSFSRPEVKQTGRLREIPAFCGGAVPVYCKKARMVQAFYGFGFSDLIHDHVMEQVTAYQTCGTKSGSLPEVLRKQPPASNIINSAAGASYKSSFAFSIFTIPPIEKIIQLPVIVSVV